MSPIPPVTALRARLLNCRVCHLLSRLPADDSGEGRPVCPRCGTPLEARKPHSLGRTWALVLAAALLYLPANLLPITHTTSLGRVQSDTIMSGVIYFAQTGSWPIALVIFVASVFVPLAKLLILSLLALTVQRRSRWRPVDRTRLYRITEVIGRWSMLDVYVVTILVALVNLGNLASIEAGSGAVFFAAVVVTTMFAAESFDPRLIWDAMEERDDRKPA